MIKHFFKHVPVYVKLSRYCRNRYLTTQPKRCVNLLMSSVFCRPCVICGQELLIKNYSMKKKEKVLFRKTKNKDKPVEVWRGMTVAQLAKAFQRELDDIFEAMLYVDNCDSYEKKSSVINNEKTIQDIGKRLGKRTVCVGNPLLKEVPKENKDAFRRPPPEQNHLVKRPPVVTIMGHVDHGKTTLLDFLRHSSIVAQEFGGITQHIGAFLVTVPNHDQICFLDTPGHAAFSAMRARGANATDMVVLVVAADDGVMEQTIESIKYAKAANVPIIVAINKMDKANSNATRVKEELLQHGVQVEEMGGDVQAINISARTGQNMESLVEAILALAEILEVRGDSKGLIEGVVIESSLDPKRGKLATVLVQRGTLSRGDYLVAGSTWGKVRTMFNEHGQTVQSAPPSTPVQVVGWREDLPSAGDIVLQVESENRANEVFRWRKERAEEEKTLSSLPEIQKKEEEHLAVYKKRLEARRASGKYTYMREGNKPKIADDDLTPVCYIVIKGDVDGSVEAILDILESYNDHSKCRLELVHCGVGRISPSDIDLAETFDAIIYAFNVGVSPDATPVNTNIKHFNVIYKLFDDMKEEINRRIKPTEKEEIIGEAQVLQEFKVSERNRKVPVAGCRCTKGHLKRTEKFRVLRDNETVLEGKVSSIFHLKNEVESVKKDVECGLKFSDRDFNFEPGDLIQCYHMVPEPHFTNWTPF